MPGKREILETLTRQLLIDLASGLDYDGLTGKSKDDIIDALVQARGFRLEEVLPNLSREQLKEICRALDLSDAGREKQALIERLLGKDSDEVEPSTNGRRTNGKRNGKRKGTLPLEDLRHAAKRKNIPPAGIAAEGKQLVVPKVQYFYSPRRPPVLRSDQTGNADRYLDLASVARERPLTDTEVRSLMEALRVQQPWLEWAGKREEELREGFRVDPVALHIHERVSAQAVIRVAARQDVERTLFGDPEQAYHEAVQFYRHDIHWANRLILGDCLQVMASLSRREDLAGKVQMIYIDPPYGIRFASNFQPAVNKRNIQDKDVDLTREAEQIKAYRDTWNLGAHSYLSYFRKRIVAAYELLADSGSVFIQIADENVHRLRLILDEVFGSHNFSAEIAFKKTSGIESAQLASSKDWLLWYFKDHTQAKFRRVYRTKVPGQPGAEQFDWVQNRDGSIRRASDEEIGASAGEPPEGLFSHSDPTAVGSATTTYFEMPFQGKSFQIPSNRRWRTPRRGMDRLAGADRLMVLGDTLRYKRFLADSPVFAVTDWWEDTGISGFGEKKMYVVQTATKVVERCMLMTTDPGDLVLDPTCGSGTTAYVAEQWGRRWITIDTSRVAVAIARQRLMTAKYDYYKLRRVTVADHGGNPTGPWLTDPEKHIDGPVTFECKTVPHITLKSIAQNTNLDPIFAKHDTILNDKLKASNKALATVTDATRQALAVKLLQRQRAEGRRAVSDADRRRWELPKKGDAWERWQVPFDTDPHWPKELQEAITDYRNAWRGKMDEVNQTIDSNAEQEELVDRPESVRGILRVSGPFTVEAVQPPEESLGHIEERTDNEFAGEESELPDRFALNDIEHQQQNVQAYLDQILRLLKVDGVRFPDRRQMTFSRLDPLIDAPGLHGEGRWVLEGETDADREGRATVAVAFGPQYGPVTAVQVEELIRTASRRGYDDLVVAGFSFDAEAQTTIEHASHPKLRITMAHIRPDVNPGMTGLLKEQPGSQLFTVFGRPRVKVKTTRDGYIVKLEGVDIYDPVTNTITSSGASKVAAWFIDGDYDGRTFCITQAFFPNRDAWDKLAKALSSSDVIDSSVFEALSGTESLPFPAGKHKKVAVKVIDPRGNEVMHVHRLE